MAKLARSISLKAWIDKIGVHKLAKTLNVAPSTIWHWRRGYNLPKYSKLNKIIKLSGGALSHESIVSFYYSAKNKQNRRKD